MFVHVRVFLGDIAEWVKPERSLTMVGVLGGFIILTWQLDRQHRNSLSAEAIKARNTLWLEIYREFASASDRASRGFIGSPTTSLVLAVRFQFSDRGSLEGVTNAKSAAVDDLISL